jgi:hypothetical protein
MKIGPCQSFVCAVGTAALDIVPYYISCHMLPLNTIRISHREKQGKLVPYLTTVFRRVAG